jgi:hypothetical protein
MRRSQIIAHCFCCQVLRCRDSHRSAPVSAIGAHASVRGRHTCA